MNENKELSEEWSNALKCYEKTYKIMKSENKNSLIDKIKDSYTLLKYSKTIQLVIDEKIKKERLNLK